MKSKRRVLVVATTLWPGALLCLFLMRPPGPAWATSSGVFTFENVDIGTVAKQIGQLTGTPFLFDPEQVNGRITLLANARADELAYTLSMVAPPWVRIVPYYATNSLIISGHPAAVEELVDVIK